MEKEERLALSRIIVSAVILVFALVFPSEGILRLILFLIPYLIVSYDVLFEAAENIFHGEVFDENFLMSVASIGAFCLGEYPEAVAVMLLFKVGELFEDISVDKSRKEIASLMDIRPEFARVFRGGETAEVSPDSVTVGETIIVTSGERIPLDGTVTEGCSDLNTAALTGESAPRSVSPGDSVASGCVNIGGLLKIRVTRPYGDSTVARILALVETSAQNKSTSERFITRFARVYTPAVVAAAALIAVVPSLLTGDWGTWVYRALVFLVVSCPCALVISVPLTFYCGIGCASSRGILIKGSNHLEALSSVKVSTFDKTGTLTKGIFEVSGLFPADGIAPGELLSMAALAECWSEHPIARSVTDAAEGAPDRSQVRSFEELPGMGVRTVLTDGSIILAGNERLMRSVGVDVFSGDLTCVHVSLCEKYLGYIALSDALKPDSTAAVSLLKDMGVRTVMLTGDTESSARSAADALGIDEYRAGLLPDGKVAAVEELINSLNGSGTAVFVGDGINDAPVLARADCGVAMGALGSDAAVEAADVVIMDDNPLKLTDAISIAVNTRRIAKQNIAFSLAVKAAVLLLGAIGHAGMWSAVFADVGVCMIAILNAMRAMRVK